MGTSEAMTTFGLLCIVTAIVGGGLKVLGHEFPLVEPAFRQVLLALFGTALIIAWNFSTVS
ncbi:hypothetical protein AWB65_06749 [Caballeronia humi]|uniref:Uncharacterized protein n=2 Tax=Caballeronia humi TaxID=326474 RepID=A0A158JIR8_9BURK|nr:hypothetical protein AWB65_06749 [Caballeronia humi]